VVLFAGVAAEALVLGSSEVIPWILNPKPYLHSHTPTSFTHAKPDIVNPELETVNPQT
jgi:hypothetical protein